MDARRTARQVVILGRSVYLETSREGRPQAQVKNCFFWRASKILSRRVLFCLILSRRVVFG